MCSGGKVDTLVKSKMEIPGRRYKGRPKIRLIDAVREDMQSRRCKEQVKM